MSIYAKCSDCPGEVIVGKFDPIRVPLTDDDGFPMVDLETGELLFTNLNLPRHRVSTPVSEFRPSSASS